MASLSGNPLCTKLLLQGNRDPNACASQHSWQLYGPPENRPIVSAWEEASDLTRGALDASIIQVHARSPRLLEVL